MAIHDYAMTTKIRLVGTDIIEHVEEDKHCVRLILRSLSSQVLPYSEAMTRSGV